MESVLSAHWSHGHPACSALSVITIAPCTSIWLRKCLRLRLWPATHGVCRSAYGLRCAAAQCSVKSVLQRLWRAWAHSPPSIGWFSIPIPCKPNTLTAFGGPCYELMTYSCAVAHLLPCLHFTAHRHRLNTKLRRKQVEPHFRQTIFGEPKISKSGIGKRERNQYCVLVISRTPASSPHNALHIPLG